MASIILYDLPSKPPCKCWSHNPWKARMALNYKGLDYETEWLEYPDVGPKLKSLGIPPNDSVVAYTIPTAKIEDEYVMDSVAIGRALDKRYPSPPLHMDDPMLQRVLDAAVKLRTSCLPVFVPAVHDNLLNEASKPYFYATRAERIGKPIPQWLSEQDMDKVWGDITDSFREIAKMLNEKPGPYFMGEEISFADFVLVGFLHFLRRMDEVFFQRAIAVDESFMPLYNKCSKWLARDDH